MKYKGYIGRVVFDAEAGILAGEVVNTKDVITFQGTTVEAVTQAFRDSVDDYLVFCKERGERPEKPFSGKFMMRVPPRVHQKIYLRARQKGQSLNAFVLAQLCKACGLEHKSSRKVMLKVAAEFPKHTVARRSAVKGGSKKVASKSTK